MDDQCKVRICRQLTAPVNDEPFGGRIEVALTKRRRIVAVEKLPQFRDTYLDNPTIVGDGVARDMRLGLRAHVPVYVGDYQRDGPMCEITIRPSLLRDPGGTSWR